MQDVGRVAGQGSKPFAIQPQIACDDKARMGRPQVTAKSCLGGGGGGGRQEPGKQAAFVGSSSSVI